MTRNSLRDQLEAWKAGKPGFKAAPKTSSQRQEKKNRNRRKDRISKKQASSSIDELKRDIRRSWANGYTGRAVSRLIDLGKEEGKFWLEKSITSLIVATILKLRRQGSIDLDGEVLAYSALSDKKSILSIAANLVAAYSGDKNLDFGELRASSTENFQRYLRSVIKDPVAQKVILPHLDEAISLAEERSAQERARHFIERAKALYHDLNVCADAPIPTSDDLRLAAAWTNDPSLEGEDFDQWVLSGTNFIPDNTAVQNVLR